ncbi:mitochondrial division protein 1 [Microthyrium microscopicum]|uniref:Mitochondrial division protein 1 n=1 Tax=Microthyrium microscopicum TaxID=703497 RepID=A0A6A6UMA8_9PEZI|nr:mitochondrial division protein 1 [Microthyrium microscopicum]
MASSNDPNVSWDAGESDDPLLPTRQIETFSRKVTATASHLIGSSLGEGTVHQYQNALGEIHRQVRRPVIQRSLLSFAQNSPREIYRSTINKNEIQHRALVSVPEDLLDNIPAGNSMFSLFQGFRASLPEDDKFKRKHGRHGSRGRKLLTDGDKALEGPDAKITDMRNDKQSLTHRLEMMAIRKNMCSSEIYEIDTKIANLNHMRQIVLDRLANLEQEEMDMEEELVGLDNKIDDLQEELDDAAALAKTPTTPTNNDEENTESGANFMSESIYEKLPSPKIRRRRPNRRISTPILHEHLQPGSKLKEMQAHNDMITAMDFDIPFGTMVTAALDDTVRVWDLNAGRCMGMLEGHLSSVRCLQVEEDIVATGSMDASIRLWDLGKARYAPRDTNNRINKDDPADEDDGLDFQNEGDEPPAPPPTSMEDCPLFSLEAHVAEVTALHFRGDTLVSGSADKTLRQWDLEKGRCVQTLDVLWAAAQATATTQPTSGQWKQTGRLPDAAADFVGALQVFDAALACGTADGMVRLWDLRSGQVHRSLVGHTGPISALQFDDIHLVTASLDRSIRMWDLRTGSIHDAFGYDNPITSMMFDSRRIIAAAGEDVVKVYDKTDGRQWNLGSGLSAEEDGVTPSTVERVRIKDGYLIEGRKDGMIGVWSC